MANPQQHIKHYTLVDIEKYIQGKMSPAEMHALEKASLQDPFLADALEGYTHSSPQQTASYLQHIQQQILNGRQQKNKQLFSKIWFKAAASVISICSVGAILWAVLDKENNLSKTIPNEQQILPPSKAIITPPNNISVDKTPQQPNKKMVQGAKPALEHVESNTINRDDIGIQKDEATISKSPKPEPITYETEENRLKIEYEIPEKKGMNRQEIATDNFKNKEVLDIAKKSKDEVEAIKSSPRSTPINAQTQGMEAVTKSSRNVTDNKIIQNNDASPEGGWPAFETYVQKKIAVEKQYIDDKLSDNLKEIQLTFSIDENRKPYNIQIVQSSGNIAYDHKMISILQEGPKWILNKENKRVKINIELP